MAPPPPPPPDNTSTIGQAVTNPVTGLETVVSDLIRDPAGTPTAGTLAFVQTADGYLFLVNKVANDIIYADETPPVGMRIVSIDNTAHTMILESVDNPGTQSDPISTRPTVTEYFGVPGGGGAPESEVLVSGAGGYENVKTGSHGSGGRDGALVVPPSSGDDGGPGPLLNYTNTTIISASNKIGIQVGSIGGNGGNGGDS